MGEKSNYTPHKDLNKYLSSQLNTWQILYANFPVNKWNNCLTNSKWVLSRHYYNGNKNCQLVFKSTNFGRYFSHKFCKPFFVFCSQCLYATWQSMEDRTLNIGVVGSCSKLSVKLHGLVDLSILSPSKLNTTLAAPDNLRLRTWNDGRSSGEGGVRGASRQALSGGGTLSGTWDCKIEVMHSLYRSK